MTTRSREGGLDTCSLALAARPPEGRWRAYLSPRCATMTAAGSEVSTPARWRSLLDHR